jgi:hypothetical protein
VSALKDPRFWWGALTMYILLAAFPQLNIRVGGVKGSIGRAG